LTIQPGESLFHFNRRVEDEMQPLLNSVIQSSSVRKTKVVSSKEIPKTRHISLSEKASTQSHQGSQLSKGAISTAPSRPTDFVKVSASAPRRLNDIVQAPPQLKKFPRGALRLPGNDRVGAGDGVVSMSQKLMMEAERENAIKRYRDLKERRLKEKTVCDRSVH